MRARTSALLAGIIGLGITRVGTSQAPDRPKAKSVKVASRTKGIIVRVLVEKGDKVEAGQVLAEFDDALAKLDVKLAQSKLLVAKLEHSRAQADLDEAMLQVEKDKKVVPAI